MRTELPELGMAAGGVLWLMRRKSTGQDAVPAISTELEVGQAKRRILVVEDEWLVSLQIEQFLTSAGFEVVGTAADARIESYRLADPGQHVDGPEQYFYPYIP